MSDYAPHDLAACARLAISTITATAGVVVVWLAAMPCEEAT